MQGHALEPLRAAMAPALQPMLDLYTDLYNAGFSVTFITGRSVLRLCSESIPYAIT